MDGVRVCGGCGILGRYTMIPESEPYDCSAAAVVNVGFPTYGACGGAAMDVANGAYRRRALFGAIDGLAG